MPLNISGSVITSDSADTLDEQSIVTRDLVYHLDAESPNCYAKEGSAKAHDISGAMINSGTMYTGNAISFDGSNDSIVVGALADPPRDSGSVSCWVNVADTSSPVVGKFIDSQGGWFGIQRVGSSINVYAGYTGSGPYATNLGSIGANAWYHVCGTHNAYGSGDIRVYINGKQVGSTYTAAGGTTQGNSFTIGPNGTGASKICDMRVYNIGLTDDQVNEIYRNPGTSIPAGAVPTNLAGWWPMSEGSGTTAWDCSGNEKHGTLTNGPSYISGQASIPQLAGKGHSTKMMFAPNDDKVDFGDLGFSNSVSAISVSMWIKPNIITADDGGWEFWPTSGLVREFSLGVYNSNYHTKIDGTAYNYAAGSAKYWTHVVVTYDGSYHRLYKNGILVASNAHTSHPDLDGASFVVGTYDQGNYYADGTFDEMAVWDVALGIDDIIALSNKFNNKPNPPDARIVVGESLVGYWRNDGIGRWQDLSGNGNHGTVTGSPSKVYFPRGIDENRDSQGFFSPVSTFKLDGLKDFIKPADNALFNFREQITVLTWIRPNGSGTYRRIINKEEDNASSDRPFTFSLQTNGKLYVAFNDYDATLSADTVLSDGVWYHVGFTYDKDAGSDNELKIYLNGVIDGTANYSTILDSNSKVPGIGAGYIYNASPDSPFEGNMANVQMYDRELSSKEVQHNFNVQRNRFGV